MRITRINANYTNRGRELLGIKWKSSIDYCLELVIYDYNPVLAGNSLKS
jgi:hypothetical protein